LNGKSDKEHHLPQTGNMTGKIEGVPRFFPVTEPEGCSACINPLKTTDIPQDYLHPIRFCPDNSLQAEQRKIRPGPDILKIIQIFEKKCIKMP